VSRPLISFPTNRILSKRRIVYASKLSVPGTLSVIKLVFWISLQLIDILCTSAVKLYDAKITIRRSSCFSDIKCSTLSPFLFVSPFPSVISQGRIRPLNAQRWLSCVHSHVRLKLEPLCSRSSFTLSVPSFFCLPYCNW